MWDIALHQLDHIFLERGNVFSFNHDVFWNLKVKNDSQDPRSFHLYDKSTKSVVHLPPFVLPFKVFRFSHPKLLRVKSYSTLFTVCVNRLKVDKDAIRHTDKGPVTCL